MKKGDKINYVLGCLLGALGMFGEIFNFNSVESNILIVVVGIFLILVSSTIHKLRP